MKTSLSKHVYIVISHMKTIKNNKLEMVEKCEFVSSLKNKHYTQASVIIDYLTEKIIKNRSDNGTYSEFEWHLHKTYPIQMKEIASEYGQLKSEMK